MFAKCRCKGNDYKKLDDEVTRLQHQVNSLTKTINILGELTKRDIVLRSGAGDNFSSVWAHSAVLRAKSTFFFPIGLKTLTFQELDPEELNMFSDFLYTDDILFAEKERLRKHAISLLSVAHKYKISSLKMLCEREMLADLKVKNVLEYLEISDKYGSTELKNAAIDMIKRNKQVMAGSSELDDFVAKNPHLAVELFFLSGSVEFLRAFIS